MKQTVLNIAYLFIGLYASKALKLCVFPDTAIISKTPHIVDVAYHSVGLNRVDFSVDNGQVISFTRENLSFNTNFNPTLVGFINFVELAGSVPRSLLRKIIICTKFIPRLLAARLFI